MQPIGNQSQQPCQNGPKNGRNPRKALIKRKGAILGREKGTKIQPSLG